MFPAFCLALPEMDDGGKSHSSGCKIVVEHRKGRFWPRTVIKGGQFPEKVAPTPENKP